MQRIMSGAWGWKQFNLAGQGVYMGSNVFVTLEGQVARLTGSNYLKIIATVLFLGNWVLPSPSFLWCIPRPLRNMNIGGVI